MVAGTVRYSTMIPVPVATLYPLKYRRRYFCELELDPGAGAVDTAFLKREGVLIEQSSIYSYIAEIVFYIRPYQINYLFIIRKV